MARDRKRQRQRRDRVGRGQRKAAESARGPERAGAVRTAGPAGALAVGSAAASGIPAASAGAPGSYIGDPDAGLAGASLGGDGGAIEPGPADGAEGAPESLGEPDGGGMPLSDLDDLALADGAVALDGGSLGGSGADELQEEEDERRFGFGRSLPGRTAARPGGRPARAGEQSLLDRTIAFLRASWSELQRMQWPDRRATSQATAVVLGFVIVAGVYLGVADWVAQKIVNLIL